VRISMQMGFSPTHDIIHTICQIITTFLKTCLIKIKTKTEIDWKHTFENKWREQKIKKWNTSKKQTLEKKFKNTLQLKRKLKFFSFTPTHICTQKCRGKVPL
jgi:hypothetical protein